MAAKVSGQPLIIKEAGQIRMPAGLYAVRDPTLLPLETDLQNSFKESRMNHYIIMMLLPILNITFS